MASKPRRLLLPAASLSSPASEAPPLVPSSSLDAMVAAQPGDVDERGRGAGGGPAERAAEAPPPAAAASVRRPMCSAQGSRRRQPGRPQGEERAPRATAPPRPRPAGARAARGPGRRSWARGRTGVPGAPGCELKLRSRGNPSASPAGGASSWRQPGRLGADDGRLAS